MEDTIKRLTKLLSRITKQIVISQKKIAASLGIAAGKVNRLMKPDGPVDQYANKMVNVVPEKRKQKTKKKLQQII